MIPDQYYMISFFISITFLVAIGVVPSLKYKSLTSFPDANLVIGTILLLVIPILFIGLRNPFGSWRYLGDTYTYTLTFQRIQNNPLWVPDKDVGFYYYMRVLAGLFNVQTFYFITAVIYILPVYYGFRKWFGKYAYFALAIHVSSMSFWPFGINGMRNGLATSIFILALAFYHRRWVMIALIAISISFHSSLLLPAFALLAIQFFNNTKWLLRIWLTSVPLCFLFGKKIEAGLKLLMTSSVGSFDSRANFSDTTKNFFYVPSSFRIDFIFYSGIVVFLGYYFIFKLNFKNEFYQRIFNLYLISNTIWLYLIYFPYTNRIAYLSWFLIPVLAIYPIIYSTKLKNQSYFMAGSVSVSLFFAWIVSFL